MPRLITQDEKDRMKKLSLAILDLCNKSGMDGVMCANAAIIGVAGVVAAALPDDVTMPQLRETARRAGKALTTEIERSQKQFLKDLNHAQSATSH